MNYDWCHGPCRRPPAAPAIGSLATGRVVGPSSPVVDVLKAISQAVAVRALLLIITPATRGPACASQRGGGRGPPAAPAISISATGRVVGSSSSVVDVFKAVTQLVTELALLLMVTTATTGPACAVQRVGGRMLL
jgi:hypothetical protein